MKSGKNVTYNPIGELTAKVAEISTNRSFSDQKIGEYAISAESLDSASEGILASVYNNIESTIKNIAKDLGIAVEEFQVESATMGGLFSTNPQAVLGRKLAAVPSDAHVINTGVSDGYMERPQVSTEAYDERDNRNAQLNSIIYNLLSARQDDFGEVFFPTIVVNPNEVGVTLSIKLFYVYNDFKRSATGSLADYARKNVVRAYADATILKNELTRAYPVLRTGGSDDNTDKFVPVANVPSWNENLGVGVTVATGALKVDTKIDLLGISQTNQLLNSGIMGPSDTLDTFIKLTNIYVKSTDGTNTDIIRLNVENIPSATFTYSPQGNYRRMILSLDSDAIVMDSNTTDINGGALETLAELTNNKARIQLTIAGSVILDKAEGIVNRGTMSLVTMRDNANNLITGAGFTTLAAKVASFEIVGYDLIAFRANSNIRQRGQLLDTQIEYRIIPVPYRSPMSVIMPAVNGAMDDNSALQNLITSTGIRVSNEAVTALIKAGTSLKSYNPVANANGDLPEIAAIGHFLVKPVYFEETVSLPVTVDSLKSHEKLKDIRAALVEKVRYYANAMYRDSEYKAAASVLTGNIGFKPTIIIGTDPVIYNYLVADGDLRTLGDTFDVKVVSTLDTRVTGKIFISFGVFDSSRNTSINPLNFGNMLWSPELTVVMPVSRDGQVSKELIVTPRFLHNVSLPAMTVLTVTGLAAVTGKVAVNMHTV